MRPAWCVTTNATSPSCRRACGGYVERVARLAPGDVIGAGAPIAELLVPQWAATQQEYLALKATGDVELTAAAEARMRLAGMPERLIREVKASGRIQDRIAITAPIGGELQSLDVRRGITLSAGQTLARINGIASVWLDVAVPQAQAALVRTGQTAEARFAAFPGETVAGRVIAILPGVDPAARALTLRIELPNRGGRIHPGLSAEVQIAGAAAIALTVPTEVMSRIAAPMFGGMVSAPLLSLFVVPAAYRLMRRRAAREANPEP